MRLLSFIFFCFSCLAVYAGDFSLRDLGDGNAEIADYEGNSDSVSVPSTIDGKNIIRVAEKAFFGNENLCSVSFEEGITEIAPYAFAHCANLECVTFPKSLKKIGNNAFFACEKISELELPASLEFLGEEAFAFCVSLKSISSPTFIAKIGDNAFPLNAESLFPASKFPNLGIGEFSLVDPSEDRAIDAEESCTLRVPVKNSGDADAYGCRLKIALAAPNAALKFPSEIGIAKIPAGQIVTAEIPIVASRGLSGGQADFAFSLKEPRGMDSDMLQCAVETRAFVAPLLKVADFAVSGQGSSVLKKNVPFDLQIFLQNMTAGKAEEVEVELELPGRVILTEGTKKQRFSVLLGGEAKPLEFSLLVPRSYRGTEIPVRLKISEKYGEYAESWTQTLRLNSEIATTKTVITSEKSSGDSVEIKVASFSSDVDKDIPENPENRSRNIFVAIIANENYENVENVAFAENDGARFYEYCRKTLGVPEKQIYFRKNATLGQMLRAFSWLEQRGSIRDAELVLYYSGHGVPDDLSRTAYLLPTDCSPSNLDALRSNNRVYAQLAGSGAKIVSVFLDACFSGMRRDNAPLVAAKGVRRRVSAGDVSDISPNIVVFTAASGDQTAHFAESEKHGIFTYTLLKKLKETRGEISLGDLGNYLKTAVREQSLKLGDFEQTPSVLAHNEFPYWERKLYSEESK